MELFNQILRAIETNDDYFTQKIDDVRKLGLSPLQKMMVVVRMLAYDCLANFLDEYVQIGERTATKSLKNFCDANDGTRDTPRASMSDIDAFRLQSPKQTKDAGLELN
ncbi:hypothetical protein QYF36_015766 [Acer negundo]|nr:hypothetical protein QYF36_015766 [Acer negundo]